MVVPLRLPKNPLITLKAQLSKTIAALLIVVIYIPLVINSFYIAKGRLY